MYRTRVFIFFVALVWATFVPLSVLAASVICGQHSIGSTEENTAITFKITFCDDSDTLISNDCPLGGTKISDPNDITEMRFTVKDEVSGYVLLGLTTVNPQTNPYEVQIPHTIQKIVGQCSITRTTYCTTADDCPVTETCFVPVNWFKQPHLWTFCWTWLGKERCNRCKYDVINIEYPPAP